MTKKKLHTQCHSTLIKFHFHHSQEKTKSKCSLRLFENFVVRCLSIKSLLERKGKNQQFDILEINDQYITR